MTEARTVRCDGCGGSIPVASLAPSVNCPYCGRVQAIPVHVLRELEAYQDRVAAGRRQAEGDRQRAGHWAVLGAIPNTQQGCGTLYLLLIAPAFVISMGASLLSAVLPRELKGILQALLVPSILGVYGIAIGGYLVWYYRFRMGASSGEPEGRSVVCPTCGAPNAFAPGEVLDRCRYCGAALMPSRAVMREAVQVVHQAAVQARMERLRRERTGAAHYQRFHMPNAVPYLMFGMMFVLCIGVAGSTAVEVASGKQEVNTGIIALFTLVLVVPASVLAFISFRRAKRRRWREALAALSHQLAGQHAEGVRGTMQWLNTYWAAPYDLGYLFAGPYYDSVALWALGFPTLLVVDPTEANDLPPKILLLVAAWLPGLPEVPLGPGAWRPPGSAELQAWLRSSGFEVHASDAGLMASADADTIERLHDQPEQAARLAPIIVSVARLAQGSGGVPVQPMASAGSS